MLIKRAEKQEYITKETLLFLAELTTARCKIRQYLIFASIISSIRFIVFTFIRDNCDSIIGNR